MNAKPRLNPGKGLSDDEYARHSSLFRMSNSDALDEMTNTLLEYRVYCKKRKLKFLNYLIEMAVLEAIEVHAGLVANKRKKPK